jgi:hypothetical protein
VRGYHRHTHRRIANRKPAPDAGHKFEVVALEQAIARYRAAVDMTNELGPTFVMRRQCYARDASNGTRGHGRSLHQWMLSCVAAYGGTEGSNPLPSSGESGANRNWPAGTSRSSPEHAEVVAATGIPCLSRRVATFGAGPARLHLADCRSRRWVRRCHFPTVEQIPSGPRARPVSPPR